MEQPNNHHFSDTGQLKTSCHVLLVDDNKVNQFLGKRILSNLGIQSVDVASDGEEAFNKICNGQYDVILTDVEMPGMNGYELSRKIRGYEPASRRHVIIALTANASEEDRLNAEAAGIDDYLTKPYSPQDLLDVLKKHFYQSRVAEMEELSQSEVFGIARVYAVFNHQENDVLHFLQMLQQQLPKLIEEIRTGLNTGQQELAFHAAHKLKSPVKLLASPAFTDRFTDFTEQLRDHSTAVTESAFHDFETELSGLLVLINSEIERMK